MHAKEATGVLEADMIANGIPLLALALLQGS
jgi:hypothetical protein